MWLSNDEAGVTLIEFTLALILLTVVLSGIFDVARIVHGSNMLKHAASTASREIATRLAVEPNRCDKVIKYLETDASTKLLEMLTVKATLIEWDVSMEPGIPYQTMRLEGLVKVQCMLLCQLAPGGMTLTFSDSRVIENSTMACPSVTVKVV